MLVDRIYAIPLSQALKTASALLFFYIIKWLFNGTKNRSERNMHGRVVLITGGTSGIGASIANSLATRGAQLVLLTHHPLTDPFLIDYILDLRQQTSNDLITAETCDLASLHSIRQFATKFIDNAPPRRLDMIILCADTMTPAGGEVRVSEEGVEATFAVNYLANFHLLSILSPAIRAQPPDREVRVIFGTCSSYMGGILPTTVPVPNINISSTKKKTPSSTLKTPTTAYGTSKLALMTFALSFQKHLTSHIRPDKNPPNTRVFLVDPGWSRTPGMRCHLSRGTLFGLALYLVTYPFWYLFLKSADQGAETFLFAAMDEQLGRGAGGVLLKECKIAKCYKEEVFDEEKQRALWEVSEKAVEVLEREGAVRRGREKKVREANERDEKERLEAHEQEKERQRVEVQEKEKEKKPGSRRSRKSAVAAGT